MHSARAFGQTDQGQDLVEHSLLMALVALASASLFIGAGASISDVWNAANSQLATAVTGMS